MHTKNPALFKNQKIVLIGYMGSGKSSVGKILADRLNLPFMDLDQEMENLDGKTIAEIFSKKGEIYFRKRENQILKEILGQPGKLVLATGGGTPCYADSLEYMLQQKEILLIYLKVSLEQLTLRLTLDKANRPMLVHLENEVDVEDFIRKHLFERSYYYSQAPIVISNEHRRPEVVVEEIVERLF